MSRCCLVLRQSVHQSDTGVSRTRRTRSSSAAAWGVGTAAGRAEATGGLGSRGGTAGESCRRVEEEDKAIVGEPCTMGAGWWWAAIIVGWWQLPTRRFQKQLVA